MNHLKYISNRISLLRKIMQGLLAVSLVVQIILFLKKESPIWMIIVHGGLLILFSVIWTVWVRKPFEWCEKVSNRFLDGYTLADYRKDDIYLTPMNRFQTEKMAEVLNGPQVVDLNKRQAQYLALQNQINPHFLYNTLESIRGEALIAGMDSVADMTEALAKFFRYTITKVENLVSVQEELDNCETYFLIQKYRFGDRIVLHVECEEEDWDVIMNCSIPKLTLQPILENSIIHGTELKVGKSTIEIVFECTKDRLIIRISDDGVGMDEDTLAMLNRRLRSDESVSYHDQSQMGGIALRNVNNRIHLIFGEEYGIHIYSVLEKGTDVEITLPLVTDEKDIVRRGLR